METKKYHVWWTSEDRQGQMDGGEYATRAEAEAAIPIVRAAFLKECRTDEQREGISAGSFAIDEVE